MLLVCSHPCSQVAAKLGEDYKNLTGDVLLSSGFIAYLGAFTGHYRDRACAQWTQLCKDSKIPCSDAFRWGDSRRAGDGAGQQLNASGILVDRHASGWVCRLRL